MLEHLYKKLHLIFISSVMSIITVIIGILCNTFIDNKQQNDRNFFGRLSMLMIYELENPEKSPQTVIKPYEENYSIFAVLKNAQGNVIYQSPLSFPTNRTFLLRQFTEKASVESVTELDRTMATTQGGILSFSGCSRDKYWGIPAIVIDKNGTLFYLSLLHRQKTTFEQIEKQLPFYILLWVISLFCAVIVSRFLLKRAIEPTEKVLKSQKHFIAAASHELKAPLAVILANNDKINRFSDGIPDIQKATNIIDADFMDVHFPILYTDRECLFQILSIFMDNAISHSETKASIQIKAALSRKAITISVIDHGQGISAEDKPYIFDRFYCADKSHTDKSHFGLGLSIAKELAELLSADIGVKNTEGGGAAFFLTLPLNQEARTHGA